MKENQLSPGVYEDLGMDSYHSWKLDKENLLAGPISCSMLKAFDPSPFAWSKADEFKQTDAMRMGSLFDCALTEPEKIASVCAVSPFDSFRTKEAKEWKAETEGSGRLICKQSEIDHAISAAEAVRSHHLAGNILQGAAFQTGLVCDIGGIPAKALLDILPSLDGDYPETIFDYKTTANGLDDESLMKTIGNFRLHWQSAFYKTMLNKSHPDRVCEDFGFIFQDVKTKEVRVFPLDQDSLDLGMRAVGSAIKNYAKCAHDGIKSRYAKTYGSLGVPVYIAMSEDERLTKEEN